MGPETPEVESVAPTQVAGEVEGQLKVEPVEEEQEENASEHQDQGVAPASEEVVGWVPSQGLPY